MNTNTYKDRLCAGLKSMGATEVEETKKFRVFDMSGTRYYVGKNGALRQRIAPGRTMSVGDPQTKTKFYSDLLKRGDEALYIRALGQRKHVSEYEIRYVIGRYELEPDEMLTARQKAELILKGSL